MRRVEETVVSRRIRVLPVDRGCRYDVSVELERTRRVNRTRAGRNRDQDGRHEEREPDNES